MNEEDRGKPRYEKDRGKPRFFPVTFKEFPGMFYIGDRVHRYKYGVLECTQKDIEDLLLTCEDILAGLEGKTL